MTVRQDGSRNLKRLLALSSGLSLMWASAALAQATGELTGTLVNISV
jgi:uncharacterized protein (DUF2141 family)